MLFTAELNDSNCFTLKITAILTDTRKQVQETRHRHAALLPGLYCVQVSGME